MDRVEKIMADCLERPATEWTEAITDACASHPELAEEIRGRFDALRRMGFDGSAPADASPPDDFPSELGHFQLHERLGGGGMGVVYRATDHSLGREVALKLIRPEILYFGDARERFRREVEAVARLQHGSIVSIHSVGEEFGIPYFAMELLRGNTIAAVLRGFADRDPGSLTGEDLFRAVGGEGEPPSAYTGTWVDACVSIATQVAWALEHAHDRGVLHRDVKPSNVILLPGGRAKLLDFGLASSAEMDASRRVTRTGSAIGTLYYMSPEQVLGKSTLDARTDVYSLGVTLYEMLTLQVPYAGKTPLEIQTRILSGEVDPIQARNRRVPVDVVTVCRTAMRRYPNERYSSAEAFAEDLLRARAHRPIEARPPGPWVRAQRWVQRNRAVTVAVAALVVFAVGLPTGLLVQQRSHAAELESSLVEAREVLDFTVSTLLELSPQQAAEDGSARGLIQRGVARLPEMLVHNPRGRAKIQAMLARVMFFWNDYEKAIAPLEDSIETLRGERDEESRHELLEALETLGIVHANLANFEEADRALLEAVELAEEVFGPKPAKRGEEADPGQPAAQAVAHVLLAESYHMQNRSVEALECARRGLALKREGGDGAESIASTVGLVSTLLQQLGKEDEAAEEMEDVYREMVAAGPPESIRWAQFLNSLGFLRMGQGRYDESLELYQEAIGIASRLIGPESPTVADMTAHYARTLSWKGDYAAAAEAYARTAEIARTYASPRGRDVLHAELRYSQELARLERFDEAIELLDGLIPRMRDTYGDEDRLTGFALEAAGRCWLGAGGPDVAEEYLLEAYDLLDRVRSEAEVRVAVRTGLARIYRGRGETELAVEFLEQGLELAPHAIRNEPVRDALTFGAAYYTELGRPVDATRCTDWLAKLDE